MYFIVLRMFLCISTCFLRLMYFIAFLYGIVWVLNITKYNSDINCNESKYCILELKMEFWHKKPFAIRLMYTNPENCQILMPTFDYIMLRNSRTVRPIFPKIAPKVNAKTSKKNVIESLRHGKKFPRNYHAKRRGGTDSAPPRSPFRVKILHINGY